MHTPKYAEMKHTLEKWMAIVEDDELNQDPNVSMNSRESKKRKSPLDRGLKKSASVGFLSKIFCISRNNSKRKAEEALMKAKTANAPFDPSIY